MKFLVLIFYFMASVYYCSHFVHQAIDVVSQFNIRQQFETLKKNDRDKS